MPYPLGHWGATTRDTHVVRGNAQSRAPPSTPPRRNPGDPSSHQPPAKKLESEARRRGRAPRGLPGSGGAQFHGEDRASRKARAELPQGPGRG